MGTTDRAHGQPVAAQIQELFRRATVVAGQIAEGSGLHPTDVRALRALDLAAAGPVTVGQLATQLKLSSPATTALVDRLETADLAHRLPDPHDRRRTMVALTPTARALGQHQLAPIGAAIQRTISQTGDEDLATVDRFLAVLLAELPDA